MTEERKEPEDDEPAPVSFLLDELRRRRKNRVTREIPFRWPTSDDAA